MTVNLPQALPRSSRASLATPALPAASELRTWANLVTLTRTLAGLALLPIVAISKLRIWASYVIVSLETAVLLFWVFHLMTERLGWQLDGFATWGKNSQVLYLVHYLFIGLLVLPPMPWWHAQAPFWLVAVQSFALIGALTAVTRFLERRGWIVSL